MCRHGEGLDDFVIGGLGKVCIPLADPAKISRGFKGKKIIDKRTQAGAGFTGGDGDGDDDLPGTLGSESSHCGAQGGPGGDAVIDQKDGFSDG